MSVRLGISPIGWSNDDLPELGGATPLDTCLAEARQAGFAGIELGNKFPTDPVVLRQVLERHGLALVSGWYSGRLLDRSVEEELAAIEAHRTLLVAMGCAVLVYAETSGGIAGDRRRPLSSRPCLRDEEWSDFGSRLTELADRLAHNGIGLAYHHHMGTVVENEAEIDRLMTATGDSVGLALDTGHLAFAGADPAAVARRYGRRINHVHCKDLRDDVLAWVRGGDASFLDAVVAGVFTVPGDGSIDFVAVFAALAAATYRGWLVVEAEQDPAKARPLAYARLGFAHLSAAVARAGLGGER
ncbi:MAG TPA: myo-inosose-2 dehydratase [Stellaceae bacterium]|nr:myo-inosose-2 dehydratase [Stellaceae bacterium]